MYYLTLILSFSLWCEIAQIKAISKEVDVRFNMKIIEKKIENMKHEDMSQVLRKPVLSCTSKSLISISVYILYLNICRLKPLLASVLIEQTGLSLT